jgi:hypothetical protein
VAKASDNAFPSLLLVEQASAPTTPSSGQARLYRKTDNKLYVVDDAGTETEVGGASSSGAWTTFTPTIAQLTVGNGTLSAAYRQDGKTVFVRICFTMGTTSSVTGNMDFTVPVAEKSGVMQALSSSAYDVSAGVLYGGGATVGAAAGKIHAAILGTFGATYPFTWANGDRFCIEGVYEAN